MVALLVSDELAIKACRVVIALAPIEFFDRSADKFLRPAYSECFGTNLHCTTDVQNSRVTAFDR